MKPTFTASVWQEGNCFVAQCLDVDVASLGETEGEAIANLREAKEAAFRGTRGHSSLIARRPLNPPWCAGGQGG